MITVVSHDAGGAKILSEFIIPKKNTNFCLKGPAINIFRSKFKNIKLTKIKKCLDNTKLIITGSSWPSKFELKVIKLARIKEIKVVTFLDHWIHYKMRFYYKGKFILPDEIWVGDLLAYKLAKKIFPQIKILRKKNLYFEKTIEKILKIQNKVKEKNLLFICSPLLKNSFYKNNKNIFKYNEKSLLKYFLNNIYKSNIKFNKIVIRPHPSESINKYLWARKKFTKIQIDNKSSLEKNIASAKYVFGFNSNVLAISSFCNKKVFNVSPLGSKANLMPFKKIQNFSDLVKKNEKK
tara:strand:- start:29344 stop:30222 length:879 start_codon:yes stop_codon:yes gene_type:complete